MKKSIILKSFLVILVSAMVVFSTAAVYAAPTPSSPEDEGFTDMLTDDNTSNNASNNANTNSNSANTNSNVQNLNALRNTSNGVNKTSNTLPKTGIQDSLPTVLLVVVFAISAIYAYKKIKDYRNID